MAIHLCLTAAAKAFSRVRVNTDAGVLLGMSASSTQSKVCIAQPGCIFTLTQSDIILM